jgi:hypothetical protein
MGAHAEGLARQASPDGRDPEGPHRATEGAQALDAAEKRAALDLVLQSATFLRADQLRNFLRYICEMDLAGRAAELSEYLIGVEALGRPPGYSTADDSSVRRRAHALRQKLEEVYATELAAATIRIDLHKGSYAPRFVRFPPAGPAPDAGKGVAAVRDQGLAPRERLGGGKWRMAALGSATFVAGALVSVALLRQTSARTTTIDPILTEAWAPACPA